MRARTHARTHALSWFTGCLHSSQLWCCHAAETAPSRLREASLVHILTRLIAVPHTAALQLDASQSEHVNFAQLNDAFNTACSELESLRAHNVSPTLSPSPVPCSLLLAFLALRSPCPQLLTAAGRPMRSTQHCGFRIRLFVRVANRDADASDSQAPGGSVVRVHVCVRCERLSMQTSRVAELEGENSSLKTELRKV